MKFRPLFLPLLCLASLPALGAGTLPEKIEYNRDIRPILSDNCFHCHGPDANHRKAKLRLDVRADALEKKAFVPGKSGESELVKRLHLTDPEEMMPPPDSNKKLSTHQQELLKRWVDQGAEYQQHWSYEKPVKAAVPAGQNAVDFLVRQRLDQLGLKPSSGADRRTLIRRLSFDLLGLPPSAEEVAAFAADAAPDALEKLIDRLLASPHYGERMAIGWLDVVRYADTIGYHSDNPRNVFPYRDYVIRSFNDNKRFDRFTIEQVAGDLLPDASLETRVGSTFNKLILSTEEGGAQPKDYEARMLTDRVRAVGAAWLGQTTGCCQCHDHKFDPLTQRDFYSLGAFFADVQEPVIGRREDGMLVPSEKETAEVSRLQAEADRLQKELDGPHPELADAFASWQKGTLTAMEPDPRWSVLTPATATSKQGATLTIQKDGSVLASGKSPEADTTTVEIRDPFAKAAALRLEVLPDPSLPAQGPGRAGNGNFVVTEVVASVKRAGGQTDPVKFKRASASIEQAYAGEANPYKLWSAASAIDGDAKGAGWGWAVLPEIGKPQQLSLRLQDPLTLAAGDTLVVEILQNHQTQHTLGHFRLAVTTDSEAMKSPPPSLPPADITTALQKSPDQRSAAETGKLFAHFKALAPGLSDLRKQTEAAKKAKTDYEQSLPRCLVTVSTANKRTVRILPRGNWMDESGEVVKAALPHYLPQPKIEGREPTRLDLAQWLVSRENPLTARTVMNRMWKQFFGTGLSRVLDDLGAQGETPANAALLDWLACEFMDSGWDVKHMVRVIVTSAAYRQSSTATPALAATDPYNREIARQSAFRLEAELVRDNALSISGLLTARIGGPSAKPYQPERYWDNLNFPQREYPNDTGENQYRRGLYTWWQRSFLHPSLLAFDAPSREECTAERNRSNIPQQALVLLNDPTYVEAARVFAARILAECKGDAPARLAWAWQRALQRNPGVAELKTMTALLDQHLAAYRADPAAAAALLKAGQAPPAAGLDPAELAAWTHLARVILNLHETITRS